MDISAVDSMSSPPQQPYRCLVCNRRFTRHENLKRHAALHSQSRSRSLLRCEFCTANFSRNDLRSRHVQRKHPEHAGKSITRPRPQPPLNSLCPKGNGGESRSGVVDAIGLPQQSEHSQLGYDHEVHITDSINFTTNDVSTTTGDDPDHVVGLSVTPPPPRDKSIAIDRLLNVAPNNLQHLFVGESRSSQNSHLDSLYPPMDLYFPSFDADMAGFNFISTITDQSPSNSPPQSQDDGWAPSASQSARGCELFFTHVAHYVPFIHYSTFDHSQIPLYLLLSMLCLGYQYGEDPECEIPTGTGARLSRRCFRRARAYISTIEEDEEETMQQLSLVQSYLLLQICAMMFLCGQNSFYGLRAHSKMISLARSGGLMRPASDDTQGAMDLETLWQSFVKAESLKRTIFAVHQIDALWYQVLSVPRQLSHLEVKHELPCTGDLWNASSAAEWAHRRLVSRQPAPSINYPDAVRRFLSTEVNLNSFPAFDPYGAINITQFLISSAREISGWCTMTGQISLERFELLKASLPALGHVICQQRDLSASEHGALSEMTWHIAMVEIEVWSPSHVSGIVEESVDSLLKQSTYLSPHIELLCEPSIASAIQPHVDWFLRYLDTTVTPDLEAPWVTLYAYKAFLIAWQFMCGRTPASMQVVGILDGDKEGALKWAKKVFQRRQRWQLGKLVLERLESLSNEYFESAGLKFPEEDWSSEQRQQTTREIL
ncbi:fungal-specific transcription factor domain-containing protein [Nemania abortiva]|nr:fungal-specific transcription factor domain-containing protein [Nemania abortiva]